MIATVASCDASSGSPPVTTRGQFVTTSGIDTEVVTIGPRVRLRRLKSAFPLSTGSSEVGYLSGGMRRITTLDGDEIATIRERVWISDRVTFSNGLDDPFFSVALLAAICLRYSNNGGAAA